MHFIFPEVEKVPNKEMKKTNKENIIEYERAPKRGETLQSLDSERSILEEIVQRNYAI